MKEVLARLVAGQDLSDSEMTSAMTTIMEGAAAPSQAGAFLALLRAKGETVGELTAAVRVLRSKALRVPVSEGAPVVDTCGTGGDGLGTFNVSTAAAFVVAAAGARVAKHGNRAASGNVGAADVLEALGARIELGPEDAARCLDACGIAFLFAPLYHPAVRHVAPIRRELGFRTLFNLTGPLCNPAGARRQVIGLFSKDWIEPVAEALRELGSEQVLVVHGADGSDEITPAAATSVVELKGAALKRYEITPEDFGLVRCGAGELRGGDAAANAAALREVLGGARNACADATALNAGAAIYVAGLAPSLKDGVTRAQELLESGAALGVLDRFVAESQKGAAS